MENFTPVTGLIGGVLIGISAWLMLGLNGRVAGISGILGGLLPPASNLADIAWRVLFLGGLVGGVLIHRFLIDPAATITFAGGSHWALLIAGGLLVGFGTRIGGGCTSGHGVCGIGRLSRRSIVATCVFMAAAVVTVFVTRHVIGG